MAAKRADEDVQQEDRQALVRELRRLWPLARFGVPVTEVVAGWLDVTGEPAPSLHMALLSWAREHRDFPTAADLLTTLREIERAQREADDKAKQERYLFGRFAS